MLGFEIKRNLCICALFYASIFNAQIEPPTLMPGIAGVYASNIDAYGLNARVYYAADHHYCFGPEVSFFKKNTVDTQTELFEANINLHYILDIDHGFGVYPLGGINYTLEKETDVQLINNTHTEDAFGVNVGAGLHYAKGRFLFFSEYKYVISNLDDHFFTVGFLINFSLSKKEKHHNN